MACIPLSGTVSCAKVRVMQGPAEVAARGLHRPLAQTQQACTRSRACITLTTSAGVSAPGSQVRRDVSRQTRSPVPDVSRLYGFGDTVSHAKLRVRSPNSAAKTTAKAMAGAGRNRLLRPRSGRPPPRSRCLCRHSSTAPMPNSTAAGYRSRRSHSDRAGPRGPDPGTRAGIVGLPVMELLPFAPPR